MMEADEVRMVLFTQGNGYEGMICLCVFSLSTVFCLFAFS